MATITFSCPHCDQSLQAPEDLAGEVVECPGCQAEITVPDDMPFDDDNAVDEGSDAGEEGVCPECGAEMEPDAVLCMGCGYHAGLGRKISTTFGGDENGDDEGD